MPESAPDWRRVYLTGLAMGVADAVPGVSGGTIALIGGVYRRLIDALAAIQLQRLWRALRIRRPDRREDALAAWDAMDVPFLVVLLAGVLTAIVVATRVVHVALETVPGPTFAFFVGLIAASAVVLYRRVTIETPREILAAIAGFAVAFVAAGGDGLALGLGRGGTFLAGAIAVSAMVLPGISGSLLLIIVGQYERMVRTLQSFLEATLALASGGPIGPVLQDGTTVVVFLCGAILGLFTVARSVDYALERAPGPTLAFLVSLVVGALRRPIGAMLAPTPDPSLSTLATLGLWIGLGGGVVLAFDRVAGLPEFDQRAG